MIATRRGLAILCAVALVLLSLVLFDRGGTRVVVDRALVPGLTVEHVTALRWEQAGTPVLALAAQGDQWRFTAPAYGEVEASSIANVLATLRGARWHRRDAERVAGEHARTLVITADGRDHVLGFGRALDGSEQVWLVAGDYALLVDAWVARALDPGELSLATRRPFEAAERGADVGVGTVGLVGIPSVERSAEVIVAPALADELRQSLAALELARLTPTTTPPARARELRVGARVGHLGGPCPGEPALVLLLTDVASGCVSGAAAARVLAAATALSSPPAAIADPRPAPVTPIRITFADGGVLDLEKRPLIDGAPADPTRVAELLAVLASPATVREAGPPSTVPGVISVQYAGGSLALSLLPERHVRRKREPVRLQLTPVAWAILSRPSRELRDPSLWAEDATTLTRIDIDGTAYQRGAVVGEWTRTPAGAVDVRAVDALAAQLASPRALSSDAPPPFAPRHRVTLTVTPPAGAPTTHALELGAPTAKGCPARADARPVLLARGLCDAIGALAR